MRLRKILARFAVAAMAACVPARAMAQSAQVKTPATITETKLYAPQDLLPEGIPLTVNLLDLYNGKLNPQPGANIAGGCSPDKSLLSISHEGHESDNDARSDIKIDQIDVSIACGGLNITGGFYGALQTAANGSRNPIAGQTVHFKPSDQTDTGVAAVRLGVVFDEVINQTAFSLSAGERNGAAHDAMVAAYRVIHDIEHQQFRTSQVSSGAALYAAATATDNFHLTAASFLSRTGSPVNVAINLPMGVTLGTDQISAIAGISIGFDFGGSVPAHHLYGDAQTIPIDHWGFAVGAFVKGVAYDITEKRAGAEPIQLIAEAIAEGPICEGLSGRATIGRPLTHEVKGQYKPSAFYLGVEVVYNFGSKNSAWQSCGL